MRISPWTISAVILCAVFSFPGRPAAWHDATHMAIVKAAGLNDLVYLAVGADMAKEKAGAIEARNHYHNTPKGKAITPEMVLNQAADYNSPNDAEGHLYGAIVAAVEDYARRKSSGKYDRYPLGYASHYLGDLSMPLHNIEYDEFNKLHHSANDGIVEGTGPRDETVEEKVSRLAGNIQERMDRHPPIELPSDPQKLSRELAIHIAAIANQASALGYAMRDAVPQKTRLTEEEAYMQLARSAQLLKAVYLATAPQ